MIPVLFELVGQVTRLVGLRLLDRVKDAAAKIALTGVIVAALPVLIELLLNQEFSLDSVPRAVLVAVAVSSVIGLLVSAIFAARRLISRQLDITIGGVELRLENTSAESNEELIDRFLKATEGPGIDEELQRQRVQRYLVDESALRHEVESRVFEFVPQRPRSVKRALNHLRLQLALVLAQGVFDGTPVVETGHVAKWCVLAYRWPKVATALMSRPSLMKELEFAHSTQEFEHILEKVELRTDASDQLFEFTREKPELARVLPRLVGLSDSAQEPAVSASAFADA
jgi:hypothetical protein